MGRSGPWSRDSLVETPARSAGLTRVVYGMRLTRAQGHEFAPVNCSGAEQVAAAIWIRERQLSRVFAAEGTSVPRPILSRRLYLAYSSCSGKHSPG